MQSLHTTEPPEFPWSQNPIMKFLSSPNYTAHCCFAFSSSSFFVLLLLCKAIREPCNKISFFTKLYYSLLFFFFFFFSCNAIREPCNEISFFTKLYYSLFGFFFFFFLFFFFFFLQSNKGQSSQNFGKADH